MKKTLLIVLLAFACKGYAAETWFDALMEQKEAAQRRAANVKKAIPLPDFCDGKFTFAAWIRTDKGGSIFAKAAPQGEWSSGGKALAQPAAADETKLLTGSWELVTEHAQFSPRDTAEDCVFDGKMWLSNGYYHGNVLHRDLYCSTDGKTWTQISEATPYDGYSEFVAFEDKMWAIKGSVWTSRDGVNWTQVLEKTPFGARRIAGHSPRPSRLWRNRHECTRAFEDRHNSSSGRRGTCARPYTASLRSGARRRRIDRGWRGLWGRRRPSPDPDRRHC